VKKVTLAILLTKYNGKNQRELNEK